MAPETQLHFQGPYLCQNWSLPDSVIYYMTQNPSSPKTYHSCKYFFCKNPILIVDELHHFFGEWEIWGAGYFKYIYLTNISFKLCVFDRFILNFGKTNSNRISSVIPYLYRCEARVLEIGCDIISFNHFKILTSNAESIFLNKTTIKYEDGTVVPFEKLVGVLSKIKRIDFRRNSDTPGFTLKTVKELLELPHFPLINTFILNNIPETFDIETFFIYLKKNKRTIFHLYFQPSNSKEYHKRLRKISDEIVQTKTHDYRVPYIVSFGFSSEKYSEVVSHYSKTGSSIDEYDILQRSCYVPGN